MSEVPGVTGCGGFLKAPTSSVTDSVALSLWRAAQIARLNEFPTYNKELFICT